MYNTQEFKKELEKISDWLIKEYSQIHTGRAIPVVLDNIMIESYGNNVPIKNIASISIEDAKTLRIIPWDKENIKLIESSINSSQLGLSVVSDGEGVRAIFPMLTTENRTKLVKLLKERLEEARIRVRKERQIEIDKLKDKTEDEVKRAKDEVQKVVDEVNSKLETIFKNKENDLMTQ